MPLYIKDDFTVRLASELAKLRGVTEQEAVKLAVSAELSRDADAVPLRERLERLRLLHPLPPARNQEAEKAFFDDLSGGL